MILDLEKLAQEPIAADLTAALTPAEPHAVPAADALWTESFAASGKDGKTAGLWTHQFVASGKESKVILWTHAFAASGKIGKNLG